MALRSAMGSGKMVAGFDRSERARPYAIAEEILYDKVAEDFGPTLRVEQVVVQVNVYSTTRAALTTVLDSLEDCYLAKTLSVDNGTVLGIPQLDERLTFQEEDQWRGVAQFVYHIQK